ncbi:copper chaperone PCu(A)C [Parablastomonas sp. CN1-191]|uniref:copper chaperone PCu(A)C n=1 Tax=Parablastomonas sp. CN1-191 TaxID=3400908 RepID=UPI003BF7EDB2
MIRSALLLALALPLAACGSADKPPQAPASTAAAPGTTALTNGRLVLPAVKGNPAAAYFTLDNASTATVAIKHVAVDGAKAAELHHTMGGSMAKVDRLEAEPRTTVKLEPGGIHVMVFDPPASWQAGGTAMLVATLEDGKTLTAPLKIEPAGGDGMGSMH